VAVSADACLARAESSAYVSEVKRLAYEHWQPVPANDGAVIAFRLDERGNLVSSEVRAAPSPAAAEKAKQALEAAAPYPPMPEEAKCLAERTLVARFNVPDTARVLRPPDAQTHLVSWIHLAIGLATVIGAIAAKLAQLSARSAARAPGGAAVAQDERRRWLVIIAVAAFGAALVYLVGMALTAG